MTPLLRFLVVHSGSFRSWSAIPEDTVASEYCQPWLTKWPHPGFGTSRTARKMMTCVCEYPWQQLHTTSLPSLRCALSTTPTFDDIWCHPTRFQSPLSLLFLIDWGYVKGQTRTHQRIIQTHICLLLCKTNITLNMVGPWYSTETFSFPLAVPFHQGWW